jgi:hypothetical protein
MADIGGMAEFETNGRAQRFETRDNLTRIRMLLVRCMSPLLVLSGHPSCSAHVRFRG